MKQSILTNVAFGTAAAAVLAVICLLAREWAASPPGFALASPAVVDGGELPKDYTGDGEAATLPLEWHGVPRGTQGFAVVMHHVAPDRTKWYWVLYDIPAEVTSLPRNVRGVGTLGTNSVNGRTEYAPPHSKGPGPKTYVYTVYALSAPVKLDVKPEEVTRDALLAAIKDTVLASATLRAVYSRNVLGRTAVSASQ